MATHTKAMSKAKSLPCLYERISKPPSPSPSSGLQVAGGATLTLTGSGLGESTCQTEVWVGDASCTVTASSDTSVTCNLDDYDSMVSLQPFPLVVNVINR